MALGRLAIPFRDSTAGKAWCSFGHSVTRRMDTPDGDGWTRRPSPLAAARAAARLALAPIATSFRCIGRRF